jgi:ribonuclease BN (tRNA processing enzyme)
VLIHDSQYTDDEYPAHIGWGHSSVSDAVTFAQRAEAQRLVLFHHDPTHDDHKLDDLGACARRAWGLAGRDPATVALATEGVSIMV